MQRIKVQHFNFTKGYNNSHVYRCRYFLIFEEKIHIEHLSKLASYPGPHMRAVHVSFQRKRAVRVSFQRKRALRAYKGLSTRLLSKHIGLLISFS